MCISLKVDNKTASNTFYRGAIESAAELIAARPQSGNLCRVLKPAEKIIGTKIQLLTYSTICWLSWVNSLHG